MSRFLAGLLLCVACFAADAGAAVVYDQPHNGGGGLNKSSWYSPDGLDGDMYAWDGFTLASATAISSIHWRGGYQYHPSGTGQGAISSFTISIYRSIAGNSQPDMGTGGRLARYTVTGNAGETAAGTFGGVAMFDYACNLASPFQAAAGTTYWVEIVAAQGIAAPSYAPDWGLATGTGGNGTHFAFTTGANYTTPANDLAFSLYASGGATVTIAASASPAGAGSVSGAGAYPVGSTATLVATPGAGYGFSNWTEGASVVSTAATYAFTASANRTLVANFVPAHGVFTYALPAYGGTVTGAGSYLEGAKAVLAAAPAAGFVFNSWSDGTVTPHDTVVVAADTYITAFFDLAPDAVAYDFDGGPYSVSLPLDYTANGVVAHFTGGYSTQAVGTVGISPSGFSGYMLYPNSVFASDLGIRFSEAMKYFSVSAATGDLVCDTSSRLRATGYLGGVAVGTNTLVPPQGAYPAGTLTLAVPAGFDSVVVHWDGPGVACQDYGPILFADNVVAVRLNMPAGVGDGAPPAAAFLAPPAPNPFRAASAMRFGVPRAGRVSLRIYDLAGRHVRTLLDEVLPAGSRTVNWDGAGGAGRAASAGLYVVRLQVPGAEFTRRVLLLR